MRQSRHSKPQYTTAMANSVLNASRVARNPTAAKKFPEDPGTSRIARTKPKFRGSRATPLSGPQNTSNSGFARTGLHNRPFLGLNTLKQRRCENQSKHTPKTTTRKVIFPNQSSTTYSQPHLLCHSCSFEVPSLGEPQTICGQPKHALGTLGKTNMLMLLSVTVKTTWH